ncbi:hypothetical protein Leryth_017633 [Lithospermum erythrorhizon]|nr:hypothetical protein Leryth_017633 [Lithospermum erythrorhizon]
MGNCQAIDNATILIQHPSGRIDKLYSPVNANQIMKTNPGHYVALLLTTTYYPPPERSNSRIQAGIVHESSHIDHQSTNTITTNPLNDKSNVPVRITRIKLLRPTDTLALGHVYRLITTHEVMKGLRAKKYSKLTKEQKEKIITDKFTASDFEYVARKSVEKKSIQVNKEMNHRVPVVPPPATSSATTPKSRGGGGWQPRLQSILESTS